VAGVFVQKLKKKLSRYKQVPKDAKFTKEEEQCIRIAALCHDLGKI